MKVRYPPGRNKMYISLLFCLLISSISSGGILAYNVPSIQDEITPLPPSIETVDTSFHFSEEEIAWPWKQENPEPKAKQDTPSSQEVTSSTYSANPIQSSELTNSIQALSQFGGASFRVAISGNYAYIGLGYKLAILDISNPTAIKLVGKTSSTWAGQIIGITIKGNYAYVATGNEGLRIVDISNKESPKEVGFFNTPGYAWDVAVDGTTAYIADSWMGVHLIDVTIPYAPKLLDTWQTTGRAMDITIANGYAFIANEYDGLKVVNISISTDTTTLKLSGRVVGVDVAFPYVYAAADTGGLRIVEVTTPTGGGISLKEVGFYDTPGNAYALSYNAAAKVVFVADSGEGLGAVDVSTPKTPKEIGRFDVAGCWANDIQLLGSYAYLIDTAHGLRVLNAANPKQLSQVSLYNAPAPTDVFFTQSYAYMTSGSSGLRIVQQGSTPTEVGFFDTPGYAYALDIASPPLTDNTYAYIADWDQGLRVVDITTPSAPFEVAFVSNIGYARDVAIRFPYAYIAADTQGLVIIDLSSTPPLVRSTCAHDGICLPKNGSARGITILEIASTPLTAYLADGENGLCAIDVTFPTTPKKMGCYTTPGIANSVSLSPTLPYAYIAAGFSGGLQVVNSSSLTSLGAMDTEGSANAVIATVAADQNGDYVFIADGQNGLRLVFVDPSTNPPTLTEKGFFDTRGWAGNLSVLEKRIMVADGVDGIRTLELPSAMTTHTISGVIKDDKGQPVAGVTLNLNGQPSNISDANGKYEISGLESKTYSVSPSLEGYLFSPSSYTLELTDNAADKNFNATGDEHFGVYGNDKISVSGQVTDLSEKPLKEVSISSNCGDSTFSDSRGYFLLAIEGTKEESLNCQITPSKEGYSFSPPKIDLRITGNQQHEGQRFIGISKEVRGRVVDAQGQGFAGVSISTAGKKAVTNQEGFYIFSDLQPGVYTIQPSLEGYEFTPSKIDLTIPLIGNIQPFIIHESLITVSGKVTDAQGIPLAEVLIAKLQERTILTDVQGTFSLKIPKEPFVITPQKEGYVFSPASLTIQPQQLNSEIAFSAQRVQLTLFGKVRASDGTPLADVSIQDTQGQRVTTDVDGQYTITVEPDNLSLKATKEGYDFQPTIHLTSSNNKVYDFSALAKEYPLSVHIIDSNGSVVEGVSLGIGIAITDNSGSASIMLKTGAYSITPFKEGYQFTPSFIEVSIPSDSTELSFTAQGLDIPINGSVLMSDGSPLGDVTLMLNDNKQGSTDTQGQFQLKVKPGSYQLTPNKEGYTFSPETTTLTIPPAPSAQHFSAQGLDFTLGGSILDGEGSPISQAAISLNDQKLTNTNALGKFELTLKPGTYSLNLFKDGYVFTPNPYILQVPSSTNSIQQMPGAAPLCPNILKNGSFEREGEWNVPIEVTDTEVNNGLRAASIGNAKGKQLASGYNAIRQKISIPKGIESATLRFWVYWISDNGLDKTTNGDMQIGLILDQNQKEIERLFSTRSDERNWTAFQNDLTQYAGKTIWVYFGTYNNGKEGSVRMLVDDISLQSCKED